MILSAPPQYTINHIRNEMSNQSGTGLASQTQTINMGKVHQQQNKKHLAVTILCIIVMITSCVACSFLNKAQYQQVVKPCDTCEPEPFNHPYCMALMMFVSEFGSIFVWLIEKLIMHIKKIKVELKPGKKQYKFFPHIFLFVIPTLCDLIASTLSCIGTYYTLISVTNMISQAQVLFVSLLSLCMFKDFRHRYDLPQWIGLILIAGGIGLIGYASIAFDANINDPTANNALGVILTLISTVFQAMFFIVEEIFFRNIQIEASLCVAQEGVWGLLSQAILMPIYENVDDPFSKTKQKMEDPKAWLYQIQQSGTLTALVVLTVFGTMIMNVSGAEITNRVAASVRTSFSSLKIMLIWSISIIAKQEVWEPIGSPIRLIGFILLTIGVFIHNNILLLIPFLKQDNKMKYALVYKCKKSKPIVEPEHEDLIQTVNTSDEDSSNISTIN